MREPNPCRIIVACLVAVLSSGLAARGAAKSISRPAIVGFANIRVRTNDLAAERKFYAGLLGFDAAFTVKDSAGVPVTFFKVNDHQYIEVSQDLDSPAEDRLEYVAFETADAEKLRDFLASRGVSVPARAQTEPDGSLGFNVKDADGHTIEFVQYIQGSLERRNFGKFIPKTRISSSIIHAGFMVGDRASADKFYRDILGFRMIWYGGRNDSEIDYVDMAVPNGRNWLEYMLNSRQPSVKQLASLNHFSLGVPSVTAAIAELEKRDPSLKIERHLGRNGKPQTNVYAPSLTRVELMGPKPVRKPCCSPLLW